jgi:magnesium chelatase accessory protein
MRFATIHDLRTRTYSGGTGNRDILFLHGWASSGRMWLRSMWALRKEYRLWAPDLPGHGDSEGWSLERYSIQSYVDYAAAFCEKLGIQPYAVIGHSMGGRIALEMARHYPGLADRVVAVSASVTGRMGFRLDIPLGSKAGQRLLALSRNIWPLGLVQTMSMYWAPKYLGSEAVRRTSHDLRRARWEAITGCLRAIAGQDYSSSLAGITHPVLLICGEKDYTVPPGDQQLAARMLPQSRLVVIAGVHHQPMDEAPQYFVSLIRDFLGSDFQGTL